jgi:hypothetical protein
MSNPTYRTDDVSRWGAGKGSNLTAAQVDLNFYGLATAIATLQANPPQPNNIASITVNGAYMSVTLADGAVIGPLALPVLQFRWRGIWAALTPYAVLDAFYVSGLGEYTVLEAHTSAATFNGAALGLDGNPLYNQVIPGDFGSPYVYNQPTTGGTVTAAVGDVRLVLDPAAEIATLAVVLPPSPTDGQV